ncbi:MAG: DNA polymerase [bacterium]|nr:DNA polymerase [bacterium]
MLIDFNLKEKFKELKKEGNPSAGLRAGKLPKDYFDLGVAFWLINPDEEEYTSEYLSKKFFHKERASNEELYKFAQKKLKEYKLEKLFYDVEMPLAEVLADMEIRGIKSKVQSLKSLDKDLGGQLQKLTKAIYKEAGKTFNINSPKQLGQILFQSLKIDITGVKKTRGGAISTDIGTLMTIQNRHPIVKYLLEYRELFKLQSTYVRPLQDLIDKDARVHTTYIQTGTSTGRLSSQNPNLQNIPTGSDWATKLRQTFISEKGYQLASFDYSQIELRVLASLSGDPKMIEAFNNDLDIHKLTAANVFNVPLEKVTPEMRRLAKTLNFGVVYGMGAIAFSKTSGLNFSEAKKFIEEYFNDFKKIKEWQEEIKSQARTHGYVTNLNGRRRWLLEATSTFRGEAAEAERAAINMPVQGLAADIIKMAMVKIAEEIKKRKWEDKVRMLLTIHDELIFEMSDDIIKEATKLIQRLMEGVYEIEVPIRVNVKIGKNWGDLN